VSAIGRGGADTGVTSVVRVRAWLIIAVWHACHLLLTTAAAPVRAECTVRLCPVPHHVIGIRPGAGTCPPAQFPPEQLSSAPGAPCRVLRAGCSVPGAPCRVLRAGCSVPESSDSALQSTRERSFQKRAPPTAGARVGLTPARTRLRSSGHRSRRRS